jgi:hypothetical protein
LNFVLKIEIEIENEIERRFEMTVGTMIDVMIKDYCTFDEAVRYIKRGAEVYEAEDLKENLDEYLNDWGIWDEDDMNDYHQMANGGKLVDDWRRVEMNGNLYYIAYAL